MIRALVYLLIILAGLCISPFITGKSGYVYVAFLGWQLETTVTFTVIALIVFFGILQLLEWLLVSVLQLLLSSRYLPERWRKHNARKHTLTGALALAEEDWPNAERAMRKGAEQGEIPALNYLAAARAAQRQLNIEARDEYLNKAQQQPMAARAVATTRVRYLLQQGEIAEARAALDKLQPDSKSKTPLLKLAMDLYRQQQDWQALKLILPTLAKRQLLTAEEWQQLSQQTHCELLRMAANSGYQELEKCWQWFSRSEKADDTIIAIYALALERCEHHADAITTLHKQLKKSASTPILAALAQIWQGQDSDTLILLQRLAPTMEQHIQYQKTLAILLQRNRDIAAAKTAWEKVCKLAPITEHWRELGNIQEQLGDNMAALWAYKRAATAQS